MSLWVRMASERGGRRIYFGNWQYPVGTPTVPGIGQGPCIRA
jgi:hypothetical protein